eukprot:COSAG03_NODE_2192_length_3024_cov_4.993846_2_plen_99_part_00
MREQSDQNAPQMTLEDRQLRQLFAEFDLDGSGELDRGEIAQVMSGMGSRATETELDAAMVEMDADGSGEVDFDEVCVRVRARVCAGVCACVCVCVCLV